jgi:hypothetical protein
MSEHVAIVAGECPLGGSFALGPWRVRRAGYGAMQLAGDAAVFSAAGRLPSRRSGQLVM